MRPYKRFLEIGANGIDPSRQFTEMVMKDTSSLGIHHLRKSRSMAKSQLDNYKSDSMPPAVVQVPPLNLPEGAVAAGTTKFTYRRGMLDLATGTVNRNALGIEALSFPRNPTDNIT